MKQNFGRVMILFVVTEMGTKYLNILNGNEITRIFAMEWVVVMPNGISDCPLVPLQGA